MVEPTPARAATLPVAAIPPICLSRRSASSFLGFGFGRYLLGRASRGRDEGGLG